MITLVLVRHGQTDWNAEGRWQGQADPPLNEHGKEQARETARHQRELGLAAQYSAALYSSDLRRALETAHIIGAETGLAVISDARLREINLGQWQGMLSTQIQAQYPNEFKQWHTSPLSMRAPGGESIPELAARVLQAVNEMMARHPGQRVGVVSHELPIAVILCRSAGLGLDHLRDLIPPTGAWQQVILKEMLT